MYDYIKGTLTSKQAKSYRGSHITVENNGVGYFILTSVRTVQSITEINSDVKIFVSLIHKEDSMAFCGFITKEERDIFNILQSVSGVGLKLSLLLLDEFSVSELINVVIKGDFKELSRAKGVGPKLAQKVILELKDKLINWSNITPIELCEKSDSDISQEWICEAQNVLLSLGYSSDEAKQALKFAATSKQPANSEEVLRYSLEYLAQH